MLSLLGRKVSPKFELSSGFKQRRFAIQLFSEDLVGAVLLVEEFSWIEVYYTGLPMKYCHRVLQVVKESISSCAELLSYDPAALDCVSTLLCHKTHTIDEGTESHPVILKSVIDGGMVVNCSVERQIPAWTLTNPKQYCWFNAQGTFCILLFIVMFFL